MPDPVITVVIPALNAGKVIAETLISAQQQTFQTFEALVVIDDGTTDDTAEITRQFSRTDPRFQLVHAEKRSIAAARNQAITLARGEFIAFLDADDVWLPQKLEKQLKLFASGERLDVAFTNFYYWDGQKDLNAFYGPDRRLPAGNIDEQVIASISRFCPTMSVHLMRKKTLVDAGLFDPAELTVEDWDLWLRMAERGLWVKGIAEPLARYRQWPGNATKQKLKCAQANVEALIKNRERSQRPDLRRAYARAIPAHKSNVALIQASEMIAQNQPGIPRQLWRAWSANPRETKWLLRSALTAWPNVLGGNYFKNLIYRKIRQRY